MSDAAPRPSSPSESLADIRRQRRGVRAAVESLEHSIAAASVGRDNDWIVGVVDRLHELEKAFSHHVDMTEGPRGLFEEVMESAPRLARQIAALGAEHVAITDAIATALILGTKGAGPDGVAETREAVIDVMSQITRHRHSGAGLVYEAYNVDIEAAD